MLQRLQARWRSWRERRRRYAIERALYKAGGHSDARHGGFEGKEPDADMTIRGIPDSPL
jgi:hypothetical protein